jgi:hypothetical protein
VDIGFPTSVDKISRDSNGDDGDISSSVASECNREESNNDNAQEGLLEARGDSKERSEGEQGESQEDGRRLISTIALFEIFIASNGQVQIGGDPEQFVFFVEVIGNNEVITRHNFVVDAHARRESNIVHKIYVELVESGSS